MSYSSALLLVKPTVGEWHILTKYSSYLKYIHSTIIIVEELAFSLISVSMSCNDLTLLPVIAITDQTY